MSPNDAPEASPWTVGQTLYHAEGVVVACGGISVTGEWESLLGPPYARVTVHEYAVRRLTPQGGWVSMRGSGVQTPLRWVGADSRRFASTMVAALEQLRRRKAAHVRHARRRLEKAEAMLRAVYRSLESEGGEE